MWAGEVKKDVVALVVHTYPLCKVIEIVYNITKNT